MNSGEGVAFEDIPFSEIEAQLMVEVGTWRNFDDIEDNLILDELLLLTKVLAKKHKNNFRMMAASQGFQIPDDEDDAEDRGDDDLPPELLEMERAYQKRKAEAEAKGGIVASNGFGIGYTTD